MPEIAHSAHDMIAGMSPEPRSGRYVFATTSDSTRAQPLLAEALAVFRETEGVSLLLPVTLAASAGFATDQPMRCITLNVYSSLEGVGLTAAVASALAEHQIPCNMIAAYHHDHVFVPEDLLQSALDVLKTLQDSVKQTG